MKTRHKVLVSIAVAAIITASVAVHNTKQTPATTTNQPVSQPVEQSTITTTASACDSTLWSHVYAGDPRKFSKPQDRLQIIKDCVMVTGTIVNAVAEADGDWHIRLQVDSAYQNMLNAKNVSAQHGYLVLEPVCSNPVSQADTLKEGACTGFQQHVFDQSMIGKQVTVVGAFVTDMEHGWNELHPLSSITVNN